MVDRSRNSPIFIDYSGKRWRRIRRVALAMGVVTTALALVLIGTIVLSPTASATRLIRRQRFPL